MDLIGQFVPVDPALGPFQKGVGLRRLPLR